MWVAPLCWRLSTERRCRVRELERLQSQVQEARGRTLVSEASLEEVETLRQRVLQLESDMAHAQQSSAQHQPTASVPQESAPSDELGPRPIAAEGRPHSWQAERPSEEADPDCRSTIGQAGGPQPTASERAAEELSSHRAAAASEPQQAGSGQGEAALGGADRHPAAAEQQSEDEGRFMDPPATLHRTDSYSSAESAQFANPEGNVWAEGMELSPGARPPLATAVTAELGPAQAPAVQHILDAEINEQDGELDTSSSASPLSADIADPSTAVAQQTAQSEEEDAVLPRSAECRAAETAGAAAVDGPAAVPRLAAAAAAPGLGPAQEGASVPPAPPGEIETPFGDSAAEGSCQEAVAAEDASGLSSTSAGDGCIARSNAGGSFLEEGEDEGGLADQDLHEQLDGDARVLSSDMLREQETRAAAESVGLFKTAAAADVATVPPAVKPAPTMVSTNLSFELFASSHGPTS